jgi:hypothetical protein
MRNGTHCGDMPDTQDLQSHAVPLYQDWGKTIAILSEDNWPHIKAVKRPLLEVVAFTTAL